MRKFLPVAACLVLAILCLSAQTRAQGGAAKNGPDPTTLRDPELERDSKKNLEAAKLYFNMRKAYRASLARCEEIIAGNPNYAVRQAAGLASQLSRAARSCPRALRVVEIRRCIAGPPVPGG